METPTQPMARHAVQTASWSRARGKDGKERVQCPECDIWFRPQGAPAHFRFHHRDKTPPPAGSPMSTSHTALAGLPQEQIELLRDHTAALERASAERQGSLNGDGQTPEEERDQVRSLIEQSTPHREWLESELLAWEAGERPRGVFEPSLRREQFTNLSDALSSTVTHLRGDSLEQIRAMCLVQAVEGQIELAGLFRLRCLAELEMQRSKDTPGEDRDDDRAEAIIDHFADLQGAIDSLAEDLELGLRSDEEMEADEDSAAPDKVDPPQPPRGETSLVSDWLL